MNSDQDVWTAATKAAKDRLGGIPNVLVQSAGQWSGQCTAMDPGAKTFGRCSRKSSLDRHFARTMGAGVQRQRHLAIHGHEGVHLRPSRGGPTRGHCQHFVGQSVPYPPPKTPVTPPLTSYSWLASEHSGLVRLMKRQRLHVPTCPPAPRSSTQAVGSESTVWPPG
jgi:hypothetical protein